jgi:hypothetical protein
MFHPITEIVIKTGYQFFGSTLVFYNCIDGLEQAENVAA